MLWGPQAGAFLLWLCFSGLSADSGRLGAGWGRRRGLEFGFTRGATAGRGTWGWRKGQKPGARNNKVPQHGAPCPPLCPQPWGPHFSQAEEESLPGAPVVEATTTPAPTRSLSLSQLSWPHGAPKFCLCPPTHCSISEGKWIPFRGFCLTTPGSALVREGVNF